MTGPGPGLPWPGPEVPGRSGPPEAWQPRPYPQALRGPAHRWWRPLIGLVLVLAGLLVVLAGTVVALAAGVLLGLVPSGTAATSLDQWWVLLVTNLGLAALVPLALLTTWAAHRCRPGLTSSVVGRLRWRWLLAVAAVTVVLAAAAAVVLYAVDGRPSGRGTHVVALLLVVVLTTPLQAAGEEYLFRGWLSQAVGSLVRRAAVASVLAAAVSSVLFALAHGSQDPWLFVDRLGFGLLASYLAWRTGGLEAGVAVHAVNNLVVMVPAVLTGGLGSALAVTSASPGSVAIDLAWMAVVAVVVTVLARRRAVRRLTAPGDPGVLVPHRPLG